MNESRGHIHGRCIGDSFSSTSAYIQSVSVSENENKHYCNKETSKYWLKETLLFIVQEVRLHQLLSCYLVHH